MTFGSFLVVSSAVALCLAAPDGGSEVREFCAVVIFAAMGEFGK